MAWMTSAIVPPKPTMVAMRAEDQEWRGAKRVSMLLACQTHGRQWQYGADKNGIPHFGASMRSLHVQQLADPPRLAFTHLDLAALRVLHREHERALEHRADGGDLVQVGDRRAMRAEERRRRQPRFQV